MGSWKKQSSHFQIGLRRILLWTVVAAVYLGAMRLFQAGVATMVCLSLWLLGLAILRSMFHLLALVFVSATLGAAVFAFGQPQTIGDLFVGAGAGAIVGANLAVLVDISGAVIEYVDKKMR